MIARLLTSRLLAFALMIGGTALLAVGALRWFAPTIGPPEGPALDDLTKVETLEVSPTAPTAYSQPLARDPHTLYRLAIEGGLVLPTGAAPADVLVSADEPPRLKLGNAVPNVLGVARPGRSIYELPKGTGPTDRLEVTLFSANAVDGAVTVEVWMREAPRRGAMAAAPYWFPGGILLALGIALSVVRRRSVVTMTVAESYAARAKQAAAVLRKKTGGAVGSAALGASLDQAEQEADALAKAIDRATDSLESAADRRATEGAIGACGRALEALVATLQEAKGKDAAHASTSIEQAVHTGRAARLRLGAV